MADTLEVFGTEYTNVAGFKATDDNGDTLVYVRGIDGNNIGYGITDNTLPKIGIGQIEYAHVWDENGQEMIFGSGLVGTGQVV